MPATMSTDEMEKLAQKLAKMKLNKAKWYVRRLDKQSVIELFRTAVGVDQWVTRFALPNKGLLISLIETKKDVGAPSDLGYRNTQFTYVEALVEALPDNHRLDNRGNTTRSADLPMGSLGNTERLIGKQV
jgi:hypothetical protein